MKPNHDTTQGSKDLELPAGTEVSSFSSLGLGEPGREDGVGMRALLGLPEPTPEEEAEEAAWLRELLDGPAEHEESRPRERISSQNAPPSSRGVT
jgi:hypothetical protein